MLRRPHDPLLGTFHVPAGEQAIWMLSDHTPFDVRVDHLDGVAIVYAAGEIDLDSAPRLSTVLAQVAMNSTHVAVDMSEVTFIDSSGLKVLIAAHDACAASGTLTLTRPRRQACRLLELTGTLALFDVELNDVVAPRRRE
ncbi:MAG: anti-sigma factor antagonist [Ilumatobacteraceae bacterium]|nr:anti-sigma factor antagonist [Ilumatobacteraceae bacterium]